MYKEQMSDIFSKHTEPDDIFLPLSAKRYAEFYSLEMNTFSDDITFYQTHCQKHSSILELGCGSGRISQALASAGYSVTGIDLCPHMLRVANTSLDKPSPWYICMNMTDMAFSREFSNILIPYNTLNLLRETNTIQTALQQARCFLKPKGTLLLQLHIPDSELIAMKGKKRFQFQMIPLQNADGRIIKETLRSYNNTTQEICLEERYRVRPATNTALQKNYRHTLTLAGFSVEQWLEILKKNGFQKCSLFGDYNSRPYRTETDATLLIKASPS